MEMEIGFISEPIHFQQIMEWALGMLLPLVSGQNHPQAQQWIYLLLVE